MARNLGEFACVVLAFVGVVFILWFDVRLGLIGAGIGLGLPLYRAIADLDTRLTQTEKTLRQLEHDCQHCRERPSAECDGTTRER